MTQEALDDYKRSIREIVIEKYHKEVDAKTLFALVDIAFYVQGVMIQKLTDELEDMAKEYQKKNKC